MSQNSHDEYYLSGREGIDQRWDYTGPDGREQPWRDEPDLYYYLPDPTPPPETQPPTTLPPQTQPRTTPPPQTQPPTTLLPQTQPPTTSPPQTQPPTKFGFTSIYNWENSLDRTRQDAFYERPVAGKRGANVVLVFQSQAKMTLNQPPSTGGKHATAMLSVRLLFPVLRGDRNAFGWENETRRDDAARWIDDKLGELHSQGSLSASVANIRTQNTLLKGKANIFRRYLGSLLRASCAGSTGDSLQDTASEPSSSGPPDKGGESRYLRMDVGGDYHTWNIREAAEGTDTDEWKADQVYDSLETLLKPLNSTGRATLNAKEYESLQRRIEERKGSNRHSTDEGRCVLGNVVLCGPRAEVASTVESSSTAAAS